MLPGAPLLAGVAFPYREAPKPGCGEKFTYSGLKTTFSTTVYPEACAVGLTEHLLGSITMFL